MVPTAPRRAADAPGNFAVGHGVDQRLVLPASIGGLDQRCQSDEEGARTFSVARVSIWTFVGCGGGVPRIRLKGPSLAVSGAGCFNYVFTKEAVRAVAGNLLPLGTALKLWRSASDQAKKVIPNRRCLVAFVSLQSTGSRAD